MKRDFSIEKKGIIIFGIILGGLILIVLVAKILVFTGFFGAYTGNNWDINPQVQDMQGIYWFNNTWYACSSTNGYIYEYYPNWTYKKIFHNLGEGISYPQGIYFNGTNFLVLVSNPAGVFVYYPNWSFSYSKSLSDTIGWHSFINNRSNWLIFESNKVWIYDLNFNTGQLIGDITPYPSSIEGAYLYNNYYYVSASYGGGSYVYKLYLNWSETGKIYNLTTETKGQIQNLIFNGSNWFISAGGYNHNQISPHIFEYNETE